MRAATVFLLLVLAFGVSGCGDSDRVRADLRERAQRIEKRLKAERDKLRKRVDKFLSQIQQAIPEARETSPRGVLLADLGPHVEQLGEERQVQGRA